jgi:Sulfotransferase family
VVRHLLHVGFPKTGSNFLRRWFREHPQLAYREGAVAGYRDVYEIVREGVAPRERVLYRVTSSEAFTTPQRDAGKVTLAYDDSVDPAVAQANVCASLAALFPNAYVLIVTRGFRSIIFSSFSQYVRTGADVPIEEFVTHPLLDRPWDYDRVIGMYRAAFGEEKVLVMPWELLRDDPGRFVDTLEERLGLTHVAPAPGRLNPSLSPVEMYWYPRLTRVVRRLPIGSRLKRIYLRGVFGNRFRRAIAMLQRVRPGRPVTADAIPDRILAAYRDKARTLRDDPLYAPYLRDYCQSDL